jgi:SAM-dependent methyltransferase
MDERTRATRAAYDAVAGDFDAATREPWPALRAAVDDFVRALPGPGPVLDVGCGPGRDLELLRERWPAVVGMDLSTAMLRVRRLEGVAAADMAALPVRPGALAGIWCQAALLHLPGPAVPGVLAGFARSLRPGGALHLGVAEGDREGWDDRYGPGRRRWFTEHREPGLAALLAAAGFDLRSVARTTAGRDWLWLRAARTVAG